MEIRTKDLYNKVKTLLQEYCGILAEGKSEDFFLGNELSGCSNYKEEKYSIHCSLKINNVRQMIYLSYDKDLESLYNFALMLSDNSNLYGMDITIYKTRNMNVVCKSSPIGMIFI